MDLPFTAAQFFDVFALYNQAVWPAHIVLRTLAILVTVFLFVGSRAIDRTIMTILSLFWVWMAVFYHFAFFTAINPAAWLFGSLFVAQGILLFWQGAVKGAVRFEFQWAWRDMAGLSLGLLALIIYPVLSYWLGDRFPAAPTFGLPCPTTIFTIGVLLVAKPLPRGLFVIPLLWTTIGSVAAFELNVLQDLSLIVAGVLGLTAVLLVRPARKAH